MLDRTETNGGGDGLQQNTVDCDLCILGTGIAGLNALFAASRHPTKTGDIVVLDRNMAPAGMWNGAYKHVRLHQPHPMFTAGNIPWRGQSDRHHLAARTEVVDHLQHCFAELQQRTSAKPLFGHEYLNHIETPGGEYPVTVHCRRLSDQAGVTVRCRRLIKAVGYDVEQNPPLALSSQAVRSVSPDSYDLLDPALTANDAPVYIVGGGKTGMDAAYHLITKRPQTLVRMLVGAGTMFSNRGIFSPRGLRRYWGGSPILDIFLSAASRFNGNNELEVMEFIRANYALSLDEDCQRFMFGALSEEENTTIKNGVDRVIKDYLVDVVDRAKGPVMLLRSGQELPIEAGAAIVNTSGYVGRKPVPYEPYLSQHGHVLSIQGSSVVHFLSSQSAYFLTHLFVTDKLAGLPLYELDMPAMLAASRDAMPAAAMALTLYNSSVCINALPQWAGLKENGLDFLLLFPPHRRLFSILKFTTYMKRHPRQLTDAMDRVRQRFGVRLGPLEHKAVSPQAIGAAAPAE